MRMKFYFGLLVLVLALASCAQSDLDAPAVPSNDGPGHSKTEQILALAARGRALLSESQPTSRAAMVMHNPERHVRG